MIFIFFIKRAEKISAPCVNYKLFSSLCYGDIIQVYRYIGCRTPKTYRKPFKFAVRCKIRQIQSYRNIIIHWISICIRRFMLFVSIEESYKSTVHRLRHTETNKYALLSRYFKRSRKSYHCITIVVSACNLPTVRSNRRCRGICAIEWVTRYSCRITYRTAIQSGLCSRNVYNRYIVNINFSVISRTREATELKPVDFSVNSKIGYRKVNVYPAVCGNVRRIIEPDTRFNLMVCSVASVESEIQTFRCRIRNIESYSYIVHSVFYGYGAVERYV